MHNSPSWGHDVNLWIVYMDGNRRDNGGEGPSRYVRDGEESPQEDQRIQKSQTQQPGGTWWSICHLQGPLFFFCWLHGWHHLTSHLQSCLEFQGQGATAAGLSKRLKGSTPCNASSVLPPPRKMILIFSVIWAILLRTNTIHNKAWRSLKTIPWSLESKIKVSILSCVLK